MTTPVRRSGESIGGRADDLPLLPAGGCFGDSCEAVDPWPVHQVRHRNNVFLRLCTSCVLKHHPGSFCCTCFEVLDSHERLPAVHCSKCPSVTHVCCLPDPSDGPLFLCPACDSPSPTSFSYFPYSKASADRVIDLRAAKILLAAARLSAASMTRAAALARVDAEKKVKEAGLARKRARDMLDRSLIISQQEKQKIKDPVRTAATAATPAPANVDAVEAKKKAAPRPINSLSCTVTAGPAAHKREQDREREKWRRFSEPVGFVNRSTMAVSVNEKLKGNMNTEVRDGVGKDEKEKKIVGSDSQTVSGEHE